MQAWWYKHPPGIRQTWGQIVIGGPLMIGALFFVMCADLETLRIFGGMFVAFKVFDWAADMVRVRPSRQVK